MTVRTIPSRPLGEKEMYISIPDLRDPAERTRLLYQGPEVSKGRQEALDQTIARLFDISNESESSFLKEIRNPDTNWRRRTMKTKTIAEALGLILVATVFTGRIVNLIGTPTIISPYIIAGVPAIATATLALAIAKHATDRNTKLKREKHIYDSLVIDLYHAGIATFQGNSTSRNMYLDEAVQKILETGKIMNIDEKVLRRNISTSLNLMKTAYERRGQAEYERVIRPPEGGVAIDGAVQANRIGLVAAPPERRDLDPNPDQDQENLVVPLRRGGPTK